ncbi:MAG: UDP-N-acetylmuramoyl-tripeptide--D-alanyl-D-alanine ligase [Clostridia bacterium]|nr:UDP-N-acetylmuramoyl-tripeptide--D-alanyl-D-alanine ligase [Clostridia bacterium]
MAYLFASIVDVALAFWAYYFIKTYQLCGYKVPDFCRCLWGLNLAFGNKNKLVFTKRIIRFYTLLFCIGWGLLFLNYYFVPQVLLCILNSAIIFLILPFLMIFTHFLLFPLEILIKKYYMAKAKRKLSKKKNLIKIAITGSFGKTSTKNILATMLEKEYKVCTTPKNYNTEMGLTKTILQNLDDHDILLAEFGARNVGDIKILTKLLNPDYGIITTIGRQHMKTFKTLTNVENTKNELVMYMKSQGVMVFNGDSPSTRKLYGNCTKQKFLACDDKGYAQAKNIQLSDKGCKFDLVIDGKVIKAQTKLLGICNINNIVTASAMASVLGISNRDIASAIRLLEPTPHRLQLIKNNFCTIIDDAYNSNLIGAREALNVLSQFSGRKIVVTPGFVELGQEQSRSNFTLGGLIADVADFIIIMNEVNKNEIFSGAISHNFPREKIFFADNRKTQKEKLQLLTNEGCVILFENDLPDNYK